MPHVVFVPQCRSNVHNVEIRISVTTIKLCDQIWECEYFKLIYLKTLNVHKWSVFPNTDR